MISETSTRASEAEPVTRIPKSSYCSSKYSSIVRDSITRLKIRVSEIPEPKKRTGKSKRLENGTIIRVLLEFKIKSIL